MRDYERVRRRPHALDVAGAFELSWFGYQSRPVISFSGPTQLFVREFGRALAGFKNVEELPQRRERLRVVVSAVRCGSLATMTPSESTARFPFDGLLAGTGRSELPTEES